MPNSTSTHRGSFNREWLRPPEADWDERLSLDTVLPSQWCHPRELCPCSCHRLMLEILADAFLTLMRAPTASYSRDYRRALWEVTTWFEQPLMDVTVNLSDCCDALGLDVGCVQAAAQLLIPAEISFWSVDSAGVAIPSSGLRNARAGQPGSAGHAVLP